MTDQTWTRNELVTMRMALAEFRDETGPGEPELAGRIDAVLRGPGDRFVIVPADAQADVEWYEALERSEREGEGR